MPGNSPNLNNYSTVTGAEARYLLNSHIQKIFFLTYNHLLFNDSKFRQAVNAIIRKSSTLLDGSKLDDGVSSAPTSPSLYKRVTLVSTSYNNENL